MDEAIKVHGRADHCDSAGAGVGCPGDGPVPQARAEFADILQVESQVGGLDVSEARRLKALEDENAKLKRMLADAMLDNAALKDLLGKNGDARRASGGRGISAVDPTR
jgi:hypothetical protein